MSRLTFLITVITLTCTGVILASGVKSQTLKEVKISVDTKGTILKDILTDLEKKSGFSFVYSPDVGNISNIRLPGKTPTLYDVLKELAQQKRLQFNQEHYLIAVVRSPLPPVPPKPGKVFGKVLDDKGEGLPGATIKVIETGGGTQTSVDGSYTLNLPPGTYTLEISYMSFATQRITGVVVNEDKNTPLDIAMKPDAKGLKEVVVTSTYKKASVEGLYVKQKNNAAITDGLSAEQIARTPDNNVGQVLRRISGLQTTDDNKFAVIRGLGERYNNVLLNGSQLPSSEPNRRNFSFDMVASALVDNVVVNKTATPDLSGEFSGGIIQINTKDIPQENFVQLEIGSGYNTMSTGKDFIGLKRGKYNYLGFLDNNVYGEPTYGKPNSMSFNDYNEILTKKAGNTATEAENKKANAFLGTLPNTWQMQRYIAQPTQTYGLTVGQTYKTGENSRLGFVGALTYRNEQNTNEYDLYQTQYKDYRGKEYTFTTLLGGNLNIGYMFGKHKISWQNTYNRRLTDKLFQYSGEDLNNLSPVMGYTSQIMANELFQTRLQGSHGVGSRGIKFEWSSDLAHVQRDQPFSRVMNAIGTDSVTNAGGVKTEGGYYNYLFGSIGDVDYGSLYYSKLNEKRYSGQASVLIPFKLLKQHQSIKAGWLTSYRKAGFGAEFYRVMESIGNTVNYAGAPYYEAYGSERFASGELYLRPVAGGGEDGANGKGSGYNGSQHLDAFYGMLDFKPFEKLRLVGGIRTEKYKQQVSTRIWKPGNMWEDQWVRIDKTDWLPSVNLIYAITPAINARAAYYKTVARPDLRETSSFSYFDFEIMRTIYGGNLKTTGINNADLRLEWYPSPGEVVSVSGFYKQFNNPIELRMTATSGRPIYTYENLLSAKDIGVEFDFRKSFSFINDAGLWKNLFLSGNFMWMKANIEFTASTAVDPSTGKEVNPTRNRPLAGQSPYVINGGISYIGKRLGANMTFNRSGRRIIYPAVDRSNDEYERPRDMVDLQISYKPLKNERMELRLNVANLLNQELITYQNTYGPDGKYPGEASIQKYPDDAYKLPEDHLDPKGATYNPQYDVPVTRRKYGTSFTANIIYRF